MRFLEIYLYRVCCPFFFSYMFHFKEQLFGLPNHVSRTSKKKLSLMHVSSLPVKPVPYGGPPDSGRDSGCQLWAAAICV